ncbi:MAG TPA: hypothetical protein VEX38_00365, partial [Fimbriimonadaceae bacterium]|nr:hypothetical protein [Fimbriimonadaceae bacterium]
GNCVYTGSLFQFIRTRCSGCKPVGTFRYNAFTWNNGLFGIYLNPAPVGLLTRSWAPLTESSVPQPADTLAYTDGYFPKRYNNTESTGGWVDYWYKWEVWPRHTLGMTFSYADGHAKFSRYNSMPTGGPVTPNCTNYTSYSTRPNYYEWISKVPASKMQQCGIKDFPHNEAQHECVGHPGTSPNWGDFHGVPGTCVADINDIS